MATSQVCNKYCVPATTQRMTRVASKSNSTLGSGQYRERFYERAVKKKVFSMPPTVLGS